MDPGESQDSHDDGFKWPDDFFISSESYINYIQLKSLFLIDPSSFFWLWVVMILTRECLGLIDGEVDLDTYLTWV